MKPISFPAFLNFLAPAPGASQSPADPIEDFSRLLSELEASASSAGPTDAAVPVSADPEADPARPLGAFTVVLMDAAVDRQPAEPVLEGGALLGSRTEKDALPAPDQSTLPAWSGLPLPAPFSLRRVVDAVSASEDDPADERGSADGEADRDGPQLPPAAVLVQVPPVPTAPPGPIVAPEIEELVSSGSGFQQRPVYIQAAAPSEHKSLADPAVGPAMADPQADTLALVIEQNGPGVPIAQPLKGPSAGVSASPADFSASLPSNSDLRQLDALVRDIAELSGSSARAAFKVEGRELGQVDVRLQASDAGVSVAIRTDSEHGRSAVAAAQNQLSDDMRSNGLKVAATSISFGQGGAERHRDDRQHASRSAFIEAALTETKQSQSPTDRRPSGRFA
ncbi:MAG TPA: flagellar hook-length control protein FliK [Sphingomicrobium sp.]|nr:flagellar hook-length control protein FliK [Sphingomicrobium sp.]